jgi:hypothetical protein
MPRPRRSLKSLEYQVPFGLSFCSPGPFQTERRPVQHLCEARLSGWRSPLPRLALQCQLRQVPADNRAEAEPAEARFAAQGPLAAQFARHWRLRRGRAPAAAPDPPAALLPLPAPQWLHPTRWQRQA